jgi:hypothetical protein
VRQRGFTEQGPKESCRVQSKNGDGGGKVREGIARDTDNSQTKKEGWRGGRHGANTLLTRPGHRRLFAKIAIFQPCGDNEQESPKTEPTDGAIGIEQNGDFFQHAMTLFQKHLANDKQQHKDQAVREARTKHSIAIYADILNKINTHGTITTKNKNMVQTYVTAHMKADSEMITKHILTKSKTWITQAQEIYDKRTFILSCDDTPVKSMQREQATQHKNITTIKRSLDVNNLNSEDLRLRTAALEVSDKATRRENKDLKDRIATLERRLAGSERDETSTADRKRLTTLEENQGKAMQIHTRMGNLLEKFPNFEQILEDIRTGGRAAFTGGNPKMAPERKIQEIFMTETREKIDNLSQDIDKLTKQTNTRIDNLLAYELPSALEVSVIDTVDKYVERKIDNNAKFISRVDGRVREIRSDVEAQREHRTADLRHICKVEHAGKLLQSQVDTLSDRVAANEDTIEGVSAAARQRTAAWTSDIHESETRAHPRT